MIEGPLAPVKRAMPPGRGSARPGSPFRAQAGRALSAFARRDPGLPLPRRTPTSLDGPRSEADRGSSVDRLLMDVRVDRARRSGRRTALTSCDALRRKRDRAPAFDPATPDRYGPETQARRPYGT